MATKLPKPIAIKLNAKQKTQARKDIKKYGVAKFQIEEIQTMSVPPTVSTKTVHPNG
jgi:hypothetical protein